MVAAGIAGGELCLTVSLLDAGVLPLTTMAGAPQPDPFVRDGIERRRRHLPCRRRGRALSS